MKNNKLTGKVIFQFLHMERLYYYNLINKCNNNKLDFFSYLKINLINLYEFIKLYRIEHPWKYRGIRFCIFGLIRLSGCGSILPIIGLCKGAYLVSQMPKQDILMCFTDLSIPKLIVLTGAAIGIYVGLMKLSAWPNDYSLFSKKEEFFEKTNLLNRVNTFEKRYIDLIDQDKESKLANEYIYEKRMLIYEDSYNNKNLLWDLALNERRRIAKFFGKL